MRKIDDKLILENTEEDMEAAFDFTVEEYGKYLDSIGVNEECKKPVEAALLLGFQRYFVEMVKADLLLSRLIEIDGEEKVRELLESEDGIYQKALKVADKKCSDMMSETLDGELENAMGMFVN